MNDECKFQLLAQAYRLADESFYSLTRMPRGKPVARTPALTALFAIAYELDALHRSAFGGDTVCPCLKAWHEDSPSKPIPGKEHHACNCEKCRKNRLSDALRYVSLFCKTAASRKGTTLDPRRRAAAWILAAEYNNLLYRVQKNSRAKKAGVKK